MWENCHLLLKLSPAGQLGWNRLCLEHHSAPSSGYRGQYSCPKEGCLVPQGPARLHCCFRFREELFYSPELPVMQVCRQLQWFRTCCNAALLLPEELQGVLLPWCALELDKSGGGLCSTSLTLSSWWPSPSGKKKSRQLETDRNVAGAARRKAYMQHLTAYRAPLRVSVGMYKSS